MFQPNLGPIPPADGWNQWETYWLSQCQAENTDV